MKLIKIDPDNFPQFKKQMLFYSEELRVFRLGEVDYVRKDENGERIIYKSFQPVKFYNKTDDREISVDFRPTHYLDLELRDLLSEEMLEDYNKIWSK